MKPLLKGFWQLAKMWQPETQAKEYGLRGQQQQQQQQQTLLLLI